MGGAQWASIKTSVMEVYPWASVVPGIDSPDTINGKIPEGIPGPSSESRVIGASVDPIVADGVPSNATILFRDIRAPGTRAPIHLHKYSGTTCVISGGPMKVFIEGHEPIIAKPGSCYPMPAMTKVSAANVGSHSAVLHDVFRVPCGELVVQFIESAFLDLDDTDTPLYSTNPYLPEAECEEGYLLFNPQLDDIDDLTTPSAADER